MAIIFTSCWHCHKNFEVVVPFEGYKKWKFENVHIQDAMPNVSPEDRELLISKTCSNCFNILYPPEEE